MEPVACIPLFFGMRKAVELFVSGEIHQFAFFVAYVIIVYKCMLHTAMNVWSTYFTDDVRCGYIVGTLGCVFIDNETHEGGVTKCTTGEAWSAFSWHHSSVFHCQWTHNLVFRFITHANLKCKKYIHLCDEICVWFHLKVGNQFCSLYQVDWRNLMKQSVTVGAQFLWGGRYGCNNGRYGCTTVMSCIEINKAVSQWLLTFNLCVSVTWPLTCAFHIPCTHTPEIIDMHRSVCDNRVALPPPLLITDTLYQI